MIDLLRMKGCRSIFFYSFPAAPPMDGVDSGISGDAAGGDKHGKNSATTNICIKPPYNPASSCTTSGLGKVFSCLDCHEPHGSPNTFLSEKRLMGGAARNNRHRDTGPWLPLQAVPYG